jgi:hypothetical protein
MGYLVEGLELFIRKVAYTKYDATVLVRWSNFMEQASTNAGHGTVPCWLPVTWNLICRVMELMWAVVSL